MHVSLSYKYFLQVQIPENIDQNIHLRITFYHKKSFDKIKQEKGPFALAFARIMEGATLIKDGIHELLVYKVSCTLVLI